MRVARPRLPSTRRNFVLSWAPRGGIQKFACALAIPLVVLHAASAPAAEFIPHRAHYKFSMEAGGNGTGVANVDGDMVADWDQSCEGWTLSQKSVINIYAPSGQRVLSIASTISTWESRDGREYRFAVRNLRNGRPAEIIEGTARIAADGSSGRAEFTSPKKQTMPLPRGTVFPTAHTVRVLEKLHEAPTIVPMPVFDGMTVDGVHDVNTVIGRPAKGVSTQAQLTGRWSWPIHLAFFSEGGQQAEPEHEIGMRLFDNGVSEALVLDFRNFKVRGTLERLELGRRPTCD